MRCRECTRYRRIILGGLVTVLMLFAGCRAPHADAPFAPGWTYRVDDGPWSPTLTSLGPNVPWPRSWRTYTPWPGEPGTESRSDDPASFREVPTAVTLNGVSACRATLGLYARGVLDLSIGHGTPRPGLWAYAFGDLESDRDQDVDIDVNACGPLTIWIDSRKVLEAKEAGTYLFSAHLKKGRQVMAARIESGDREWTLSGNIIPPGVGRTVHAQYAFTVARPSDEALLLFSGPYADRLRLNGRPIVPVLSGMHSTAIQLPVRGLKKGRHVLELSLSTAEARAVPPGGRLIELQERDAAVLWGPVVTRATQTSVHIACRTNLRVPATLVLDGSEKPLASGRGHIHRWQVQGLEPGATYAYTITPGHGRKIQGSARTVPANGPVLVGLAGDPQSGSTWQTIAGALAKAKPDLFVCAGDHVIDGLSEDEWTRTFFAPGASLLANVQCMSVPGNHDRMSPVLTHFLAQRRDDPNWVRELGSALVIGIDGGLDWAPGSHAATWLDTVLAGNTRPFVFLVSHYPAYSSRNHGKLADDGRVLERTSRVARNHIVPLLEKHDVTAMFTGHDHGYERSELPSGLTAIVTGGAGAGVYPKRKDSEKQNPYSKAFAAKHHYCLLRVDRDAAVMTAVTPQGEVIDTRTWNRKE